MRPLSAGFSGQQRSQSVILPAEELLGFGKNDASLLSSPASHSSLSLSHGSICFPVFLFACSSGLIVRPDPTIPTGESSFRCVFCRLAFLCSSEDFGTISCQLPLLLALEGFSETKMDLQSPLTKTQILVSQLYRNKSKLHWKKKFYFQLDSK